MEKNKITDSIRKEKLQLELFEKFIYLKVPALCFFIGVMSLTKGFLDFTFLHYYDTSSKIGFLFLGVGTISLLLKINRLKLISVDNTNLNVRENILNVAEKRKWKTELNNEKAIILVTIPVKGYDDYLDYNKLAGERIYILFDHKKVLLRSIDNLDSFSFKIQNGENSANEKTIINAIKPATNSHF